jgi:NAD+ diphosphatase
MDFLPQYALLNSRELKKTGKIILFSENESLMAVPDRKEDPLSYLLDRTDSLTRGDNSLYLIGTIREGDREREIYALSLSPGSELPSSWTWVSFSEYFRSLDYKQQFPLSRAKQILNWNRTHRFCGSCGTPTEPQKNEPCRKCPACSEMYYPRFSPAVIVRITRGNQILLAHNVRFTENLYSNIAGFVEAGETLEEAVRREIREEVSLEVENIRYFDSQQWPMPHSLMLAFTADCPRGNPVPDGVEIEDARWFTPDNLPHLPPPGSIARRMIDDHLNSILSVKSSIK